MTASLKNNASLRLALMGTTAVLALAPHAAQAQTAYDITFSGSGVSGAAVVTTNGTGSGGNVADAIAGTVTDTNTDNTADAITGLSNYRVPDQNIQAIASYVDNRGLAFATTASQDNNYILGYLAGQYVIGHSISGADYVNFGIAMTSTVHASIDTAQASYDETTAPLAQSTVVFEGGTFKPTGTYVTAAPIMLSSYNGGGTVDTSNGYTYFDGAASGAGGLTVTGSANSLSLNGVNSYTGGTTINSGAVLAASVDGAIPGDVTDNGYLQFTNTSDLTYGGVVSGSGAMEVFNSGGVTTILTGDNTATGTVFMTGGTLQLGTGGAGGGWAGGIADGGSVVFNHSGGSTYGGVISDFSGAAGTVTVQSGTVTFTGVSTYTGATTINSGATLALSGAGSIANSGDPLVNGTFDISGTTSGASVVSLSGSGTVDLGAKTLTLTGATDTFTGSINNVGGAVVAIGGGVTIAGGTETLTGTNFYNGATSISTGATLALSGSGSIAISSGVTANGTFDVSQTTSPSVSIKDLSGSGSVALGGRSLVLTNASGTFSGVIADGGLGGGTGGLLTIASGTETLTGANTYTGATLIDNGATLNLGNGGAGGTVAGNITDHGMLKFNYSGTVTVGSHISGTGSVEVVAGTVVETASSTVDGTVTIDSGATLKWGNGFFPVFLVGQAGVIDNGALVMDFGAGNNLNVGPIGGSGSVTIHSGTDTNFAADTYTGATTVDSGALLAMSSSGSIASSSGVTANGTFDISQTDAGNAITSLSGSGSVNLGGHNLSLTNASGSFSGVIADGGVGGGTGGGLEIAGGTETLSGVNTFTGLTTVDAGATLALSGAGSIAASGDPLVNGTFDISQTTTGASVVSLSGSGTVQLGSKTLTLTGATDTFTGVIADGGLGGGTGGGLTIAAGTETLTGDNTYTGATSVGAGATLQLGDGGAGGSVAGSLAVDGLVQFNHSGSSTQAGAISGAGSVEVVAGTEVVTGSSSIGGTLTIDNGATLAWGDGTASAYLVGVGNAVVDNGTLVIDYGASSSSLFVPISGSGGVTIHSGRLINSAVSTYTGSTTIDPNSIFSLTGAGSIAQSSGVTANGYFDVSGATAGVSIVSLSGSGGVGLGAKTLTLTNASGTFSGAIDDSGGAGGGLTVTGGTETLTGTNTYTGATTVGAGATLALAGSGAIDSSSGVTVNGTFDISQSVEPSFITTLSGSGAVAVGGQSLVLTNASETFSGVIADGGAGGGTGGGFEVGHGTETLTGVNTFTGLAVTDGGATLALSGSGAIASAAGVSDYGTFDISGTTAGASVGSLSGTGAVALGGKTLTLTNANDTFFGVIADGGIAGGTGGGLTVAGGIETLTGVNTYTGLTTVDAGATLALQDGGSIADSGDPLVNGTFDISQTTSGASIISLSGSGSALLGAQTLTLTAATDTFSGVIADGGLGGGTGGSLTIAGGTETLTGDNTYTGGTTVDGGAALVVGDGATSGSIVGDVVADGNFYFNRGDTITFAGLISGTGGVIQNGGGTTILTGDGTFTGGTYIYGGTLQWGNGGTTGSLASSPFVFDSSLLVFDHSNAITYAGVIEDGFNPGSVTQAGTGALTLTGDNTFTGTLTIDAGTQVNLGAGGTTGSVVGPIEDDGLLTFNHSNAITYGGAIAGSGVVTQAGSGTLTLTGTNTYTGLTTINSGTALQLGAATATGTVAGDILDNGALTVDLDNTWVYGGAISGSGSLTQAGSWTFGSLILTGTSTYTGGTTINSTTSLVLGNNTATGSIVGNVLDNGQLVFDRSNAYTFAGVISGAGAVYSLAPGVITLTGTNTYTGGTIIGAGATIQIGDGTTVGSIVGNVADSGTLIYVHSDTVTPVGVISGTGDLTQAGTGLLVLNGVNTLSGLTTISAGTLEVGDAAHTGAVLDSHIGGVTVGAAGTLEGHGTINGAVRNLAGGTVRPGGTIGTLTVASYSQGPASTLAIEVAPTTASLLNSLGSASLNGTLALTFDPGVYSAHIYEIVAGAPVSGTFSTVTQSGLPTGFIYGVYYAPSHTQVDLVTEPVTAGQGFATVTTASLDQAQALAGMVGDRQDDAGCSMDAKDQKAAGKSAACDGPSVWGQALAARAHTNGDGDLGSADNTSGGFIGGVDARFGGGGSIGLALAYADNTLNLDSAMMKSTGYAVFASLYGRESFGGFVFDAQGFYMDSHWTQTRTIIGYGNATSHPNGTTGGGVIQVSYPLMDGMVKPYLKVSYADFDRHGTTETGAAVGPLALEVASGSNASTRAEAGVRLAATMVEASGAVVSPELRVGVSQDLSSNTRSAQVALALVPTTTFTAYAVKPDQTSGVVAGAVRVKLSDTLDFYGDLRGRFSQNQSEGSLTIGGRYRF